MAEKGITVLSRFLFSFYLGLLDGTRCLSHVHSTDATWRSKGWEITTMDLPIRHYCSMMDIKVDMNMM